MTETMPRAARVLIADDQTDVLEALRLLLKGEGFATETVNSPASILEKLAANEFDLLLMDLNYTRDTTSGREGLDLLSRIQALDRTLPVVVMTAWGTVDLAVEAMRRGVGDFVLKPWENARLVATLREQIGQGVAQRRTQRLEKDKDLLRDCIPAAQNLEALSDLVAGRLLETLGSSGVAVFVHQPPREAFRLVAQAGFRGEDLNRLELPTGLVFSSGDSVLDVSNADVPAGGGQQRLLHAGVALLAPARLNGDLLAVVAVGQKATGEAFGTEEREFLAWVTGELAARIGDWRARRLKGEYAEAGKVQQSFLPKTMPLITGHEIAAAWQPAREVGGDSFDVVPLGDHRYAVCIADVIGKGMPAALLMSSLQATLRASLSRSAAPAEVCAQINGTFSHQLTAGKFITLWYGVLDARAGTLVYTNAGHENPLLARRDGRVERLQEGGLPLGISSQERYEQGETKIASGDRLALFTDGLIEARNRAGEEFGEARLVRLLQDHRKLAAAELKEKIISAVSAFCEGDFHDDATLIVVAAGGK